MIFSSMSNMRLKLESQHFIRTSKHARVRIHIENSELCNLSNSNKMFSCFLNLIDVGPSSWTWIWWKSHKYYFYLIKNGIFKGFSPLPVMRLLQFPLTSTGGAKWRFFQNFGNWNFEVQIRIQHQILSNLMCISTTFG